MMQRFCIAFCIVGVCSLFPSDVSAFSASSTRDLVSSSSPHLSIRKKINRPSAITRQPLTQLKVVQDLDVIGLVAGQENYGLAIVSVGEAIWSFVQAPSLSHAKVLVPAGVAAVVLVAVSGPMITSGDAGSVGTGLWIATAVSLGLGASYVARLAAQFSPSPKEIAALGLLVAIAGFFSFSQNLVVDGFLSLPSLPVPNLLPTNVFEGFDGEPPL